MREIINLYLRVLPHCQAPPPNTVSVSYGGNYVPTWGIFGGPPQKSRAERYCFRRSCLLFIDFFLLCFFNWLCVHTCVYVWVSISECAHMCAGAHRDRKRVLDDWNRSCGQFWALRYRRWEWNQGPWQEPHMPEPLSRTSSCLTSYSF